MVQPNLEGSPETESTYTPNIGFLQDECSRAVRHKPDLHRGFLLLQAVISLQLSRTIKMIVIAAVEVCS
jgi:hypothetical protein